MKFILATKQNMMEYFNEEGRMIPATVLLVAPSVVVRVKGKESDGYDAIQVAYNTSKENKLTKPQKGQLKDLEPMKNLKEFRLSDKGEMERGTKIDIASFAAGDTVQVSGITKGKGFQGVVKRHGFAGGPRTHGQKHSEREPGSIGGGLRTRVPKGMRMAGRMGSDRVTVKNLKVLEVDQENNVILVSGAVPGRRGTLLEVVVK